MPTRKVASAPHFPSPHCHQMSTPMDNILFPKWLQTLVPRTPPDVEGSPAHCFPAESRDLCCRSQGKQRAPVCGASLQCCTSAWGLCAVQSPCVKGGLARQHSWALYAVLAGAAHQAAAPVLGTSVHCLLVLVLLLVGTVSHGGRVWRVSTSCHDPSPHKSHTPSPVPTTPHIYIPATYTLAHPPYTHVHTPPTLMRTYTPHHMHICPPHMHTLPQCPTKHMHIPHTPPHAHTLHAPPHAHAYTPHPTTCARTHSPHPTTHMHAHMYTPYCTQIHMQTSPPCIYTHAHACTPPYALATLCALPYCVYTPPYIHT